MNNETKKMGRPLKYSTEYILLVMQQYMDYYDIATEVSASQIARFAQEHLGLSDFRHYTITRNPDATERLKLYNSKVMGKKGMSKGATIWRSIDINAFLLMDKDNLRRALENLETVWESIADKQTNLIKENMSLAKKVKDSQDELDKKTQEVDSLQSEIIKLHRNNNELVKRIRTIEKKVTAAWGVEAEAILSTEISADNMLDAIQQGRVISAPIIDLTEIVSPPVVEKKDVDVDEEQMAFLKGLDDI